MQKNLPMTDKFGEFLVECQNSCNQFLKEKILNLHSSESNLIEAMRYSLLSGGKRVRPSIVFASAAAIAKSKESQIQYKNLATVELAGAVECIHAYSLIHDDLPAMDDDDLRRGQPTCHIKFDEATAILAGDALQCLAFDIVASSRLEPEQSLFAIKELAKASGAQGMVLGQAVDLESVNSTLTIDQLEFMHLHKTGALIEASAVLGGISAGATEQQLDRLRGYARAVGLAFQVQDDILDVTAETSVLGKQQGADQTKNKPTYVSLLGLDGAILKAQELRNEALDTASHFEDNAVFLNMLANYVIERKF